MRFFNKTKEDKELVMFLRYVLGCKPKNIFLYKQSLIHRSSSHLGVKGYKINNERLEYLGDTVLNTVVGDYLFKKYPYQGEGFLTEMRSKIVSRASLNKLAVKIGLNKLIEYSKDFAGKFVSIDGDAFEALIGALYLDHGYKKTYKIITQKILNIHLDIDSLETAGWNYKSKIIDWGQKNRQKVSFEVIETSYVHSRKQYKVQVLINGEPMESAVDFSIKAADQLAAEKTYKKMEEQHIIEI
ncbi:MAG: ribonuclease III [Bacteroidales bacterium]|jgi:ribonuclease-3|nr:ribonuclease III [Bacteroidales bacterium]